MALAAGQLPAKASMPERAAGMQYLLDSTAATASWQSQRRPVHDGHGVAAIAWLNFRADPFSGHAPQIGTHHQVIIASQNSEGGWRYVPCPRADISVTVLQVVACERPRRG